MIAEVSVATGTTPDVWARVLDTDPRMVATVLDVLKQEVRRR